MKKFYSVVFVIAAMSLAFSSIASPECVDGNGNRYNQPRCYHSEISSAQAYILISYDRGNVTNDAFAKAVLIDVRGVNEYANGHPYGAVNIPYPCIYKPGSCSIPQSPEDFVSAVEEAFPDKDTPILTLCDTSFRSVKAANLLAEAGYVNVRNVWEGFAGLWKTDIAGNALDLNNDGVINESDKDGWKNYQGLPWTTKLLPSLLYQPYIDYYY